MKRALTTINQCFLLLFSLYGVIKLGKKKEPANERRKERKMLKSYLFVGNVAAVILLSFLLSSFDTGWSRKGKKENCKSVQLSIAIN